MSDAQQVACDITAPIAWEAGPAADNATAGWMHTNLVLMRALATLETAAADDDGGSRNKTMERLEAKVDLALDLLTQLVAAQMPRPRSLPVRLSAVEALWQDAAPPQKGADIVVLMHVSPKLPLPLRLPARVADVSKDNVVRAVFRPLDAETLEWLERTVFRCHRRAVQSRTKH